LVFAYIKENYTVFIVLINKKYCKNFDRILSQMLKNTKTRMMMKLTLP
jgi:hypothetical protein